MEWLLLALLAFVAIAFTAWRGNQRAKQLQGLLQRGQPTMGVVTARHTFRGKTGVRRFILYEYEAAGQTYKGRSHVNRQTFERWAEGASMPVRYLPEDPRIAAPQFVIDEAQRIAHASP